MSGRRSRDHGQAVFLALAVVAFAVVLIVAAAALGARVVHRQQAQAVADGAALAGAVHGRAAAAQVARSNGGVLVSFEVVDPATGTVQVRVEVHGVVATARAARAP